MPIKYYLIPVVLCMILSGLCRQAGAQTIPVGDLREEQLRLQQLLNDTLTTSFIKRPAWTDLYNTYMDAAEGKPGWWNRRIEPVEQQAGPHFRIGVYEPVFQTTVNSNYPIGENNAAAWYGRGLTSEFQGGFYITSDYFTISLRPQLVYQQNRDFLLPRFISRDSEGEIRYIPEGIGGRIDAPFRFGPDPFWTADLGHSSVRLHYRQLEAGFSNEPLWWGGAVHYPLMLSNNAPGVPHLFLGTRSPVRVPYVGGFEFHWITGWPEDSPYYDAAEQFQHPRFLNAINLAFTPQIIPNLTLGATRLYMMHVPDGVKKGHVRVIFEPLGKETVTGGDIEIPTPLSQAATVYFRWLFPRANAEIYGEFYREDHNWDFRDFMMQPHHNSAYSFGFQKIFFPPRLDFMKANLEVTSLNPSRLDEIRWQTYYYTHSNVRQGQTNRGQVLGAAIGPGSSSMILALDGYRGDFKGGIFAQRWVDNDHFHYRWYLERDPQPWGDGDKYNHRVNLNLGVNFLWGPGPYYLHGSMIWTKLFNYGRFHYGRVDGIGWDERPNEDTYNLQMQLGVRYAF